MDYQFSYSKIMTIKLVTLKIMTVSFVTLKYSIILVFSKNN